MYMALGGGFYNSGWLHTLACLLFLRRVQTLHGCIHEVTHAFRIWHVRRDFGISVALFEDLLERCHQLGIEARELTNERDPMPAVIRDRRLSALRPRRSAQSIAS